MQNFNTLQCLEYSPNIVSSKFMLIISPFSIDGNIDEKYLNSMNTKTILCYYYYSHLLKSSSSIKSKILWNISFFIIFLGLATIVHTKQLAIQQNSSCCISPPERHSSFFFTWIFLNLPNKVDISMHSPHTYLGDVFH